MMAGRVNRLGSGLRVAGLCLSALGLAACAGSTRGPEAPVIVAGSVCSGVRGLGAESLGGAGGASPTQAGLIAVLGEPAVKDGPAELLVMELGSQRLLWKKPVKASARPQILENVVVTSSGEELVAFDLTTGNERFRSALGRPLLIGAAQSGETVLITTGTSSWDPKQRGSSLIALDAHSGDERWRRDVPYSLSAPAIRAQRALVVSDHADLWTLDLERGSDTGCGPLGGNTVEWLDAAPSGLLFGAAEARQLGPDAREAAGSLELARRDLPGRPFIRGSSYLPVPAARSAHGRVAAIAPLRTSEGGPALAGDMFYFVFYRDVFGFRADGSLAWAQLVDADVARARASETGLWLVTEAGILLQLDAATGEPSNAQSLGVRVASAELRPATAAVQPSAPPLSAAAPATEQPAAPPASAPSQPASPQLAAAAPANPAAWQPPKPYTPTPEALARLQASLRRVADDTDARLLPARSLAVDEIAALETPSATGDLLAIYAAPNTPSQLRERIAKRIRERTSGSEHLVAALAQHQDFLEERPAPPLRAIVPGVVTQHDTNAVPGLIDQLFDPNTPVSDLGLVVSAIDALSGDQGREPLRRFFAMYRADSAFAHDPSALVLTAQALLARNDASSRSLLEATRDSALASPALREELSSLLAPPPAAAPPEQVAVVAAAPEAGPPPPIELRTLLEAARPQLAPCVDAAQARSPKLTTVRLWFVALPDGSVRDVRVMPIDKQLASCLEQKLAEMRLPNDRKQLVGFQLAVTPAAASASSEAAATSDDFWAMAQLRASKHTRSPQTPPWWQDKNPLFVVMDATTGLRAAQQPAEPQTAAQQPVAAPTKSTEPKQPQPKRSDTRTRSAQPEPSQPPPAASGPKPAAAEPPQPGSEDAWWLPQEGKR
ncbi:MAG TPA: PQQ-binding-like beta-propeller repeat protein [Polyangiales bacterium]|nr:PQQ-binding-like beta-propeller repeat protein [Polyangiales bacterium]